MEADFNAMTLGAKVHEIRKRLGLTLTQLGERSGISASALSKIERDKLSPTYANLIRLAAGLDVGVSQLFGTPDIPSEESSKLSVMRLDEGEAVDTGNYLHYYLHMSLQSRSMTPLIVDHHAKTLEEFGPLISHPGQEFTYVLTGVVEVHVGNNPPVRLSPGESIYFDSTLPHAYLAASRTPCRSLGVCSNIDQAELGDLLRKSRNE